MTIERRPMGQVRINDEGYVEFVPEGKWRPSKRWEDSPDGRRVAKFRRRNEMAKLKKKIERLKAGLPSEPPPPKPLTTEEQLDHHYRNLENLREIIPNVEKGGYGYRVMMRSLKDSLAAIEALEAGQEPERRARFIEKATMKGNL